MPKNKLQEALELLAKDDGALIALIVSALRQGHHIGIHAVDPWTWGLTIRFKDEAVDYILRTSPMEEPLEALLRLSATVA